MNWEIKQELFNIFVLLFMPCIYPFSDELHFWSTDIFTRYLKDSNFFLYFCVYNSVVEYYGYYWPQNSKQLFLPGYLELFFIKQGKSVFFNIFITYNFIWKIVFIDTREISFFTFLKLTILFDKLFFKINTREVSFLQFILKICFWAWTVLNVLH